MKATLRCEALGTEKSVAVEDGIMLKSVICTAGSEILNNFTSPLTATVADKLADAGYAIAGTVQMDEFWLDRVTSDKEEIKSGAVEAVAAGETSFALGNDLSGKLRRQAAQADLCYLHPTYGTVSRFGLVAAAASMDQIGVVAKTPDKAFELLGVIAGHDNRDGAMFPETSYTYSPTGEGKILVPDKLWEKAPQEDRTAMAAFVAKLGVQSGFESYTKPNSDLESGRVCLPYFEHYAAVQYILACAEISNNISRFDGIKFGHRAENFRGLDELYSKSRTEGFALEAKLCALLGCLVLSEEYYTPYYDKSMRMRRLIRDSLLHLLRSENPRSDSSKNSDKLLGGYNLMLLPARLEGTPFEQSAVYAAATLAGLPALSFSYEGGILQLIAAPKCENTLYSAWEVASR